MKALLSLVILSMVSMSTFAKGKQSLVSQQLFYKVECVFEEPFFKTTYIANIKNKAYGHVMKNDLVMGEKTLLKGMVLKRTGAKEMQILDANGRLFQVLSFVGKGSHGRSQKSDFFRGTWSGYGHGPAPVGECHTL